MLLVKQGFNSWKDETTFNELQGGLREIYKNIDKYYPNSDQEPILLEESQMVVKKPKYPCDANMEIPHLLSRFDITSI